MKKLKEFYNSHKPVCWLLGVALSISLPFIIQRDAVMTIVVRIVLYMILASGLNIANGYIGLSNIGSAGFFCLGAYTTALLTTRLGWSVLPTMLCAAILTAIIGALFAFPTARFSGFYFSITTMGFSEIIRLIALNWVKLTRGSNGIHSIPKPVVFGLEIGTERAYYFFMLVILAGVLFCIHRILNSKIGRAWISIRENPDAARSLGVEILKYKSYNFMVMGFILGLGGSLMAYYYRYISPEMFQIDNGHQVLAMVILGGLGSLAGPLVGAAILSTCMELLRSASEFRMIAYAVIVLLMMWVRPQGITLVSDSSFLESVISIRSIVRRNF